MQLVSAQTIEALDTKISIENRPDGYHTILGKKGDFVYSYIVEGMPFYESTRKPKVILKKLNPNDLSEVSSKEILIAKKIVYHFQPVVKMTDIGFSIVYSSSADKSLSVSFIKVDMNFNESSRTKLFSIPNNSFNRGSSIEILNDFNNSGCFAFKSFNEKSETNKLILIDESGKLAMEHEFKRDPSYTELVCEDVEITESSFTCLVRQTDIEKKVRQKDDRYDLFLFNRMNKTEISIPINLNERSVNLKNVRWRTSKNGELYLAGFFLPGVSDPGKSGLCIIKFNLNDEALISENYSDWNSDDQNYNFDNSNPEFMEPCYFDFNTDGSLTLISNYRELQYLRASNGFDQKVFFYKTIVATQVNRNGEIVANSYLPRMHETSNGDNNGQLIMARKGDLVKFVYSEEEIFKVCLYEIETGEFISEVADIRATREPGEIRTINTGKRYVEQLDSNTYYLTFTRKLGGSHNNLWIKVKF
ncbi:MAG: hypothetical protein Crog4KO_25400 [Crocinitomicaceae bacterium]